MTDNSSSTKPLQASSILLLAAILMALAIASAFFGLTVKQDQMIRQQIEIAARNYFDTIVITRRWNAGYGGVYVAKKGGMASNPYLEDPDIITQDGHVFTKKNPALMTREISELAQRTDGYQYHITSLKVINPINAPDDWERQSLQQFESGTVETTALSEGRGKKIFRLMRPLYFESGCIDCHGEQGYTIGEVRGGISVTLPYDEIAANLKSNRLQMLALAALVLACLVAIFYLGAWRLLIRLSDTNTLLAAEKKKLRVLTAELERKVTERNEELLAANQKLQQESAERQKVNLTLQQQSDFEHELLEAIPVPVFYKDAEGRYLGCNSNFAQLLGLSKKEIIGKTVFDLAPQELAAQYHAQDESLFRHPGLQVYPGQVQSHQGGPREVIFHKATFNQPDGSLGGLIGAILDITQQKQTEDELLRHRHQLEEEVDERTKGLKKTQTALHYLLEDVSTAKKELEAKVAEIERMNRLFVNRELRMIELKEKIRALEQKKKSSEVSS